MAQDDGLGRTANTVTWLLTSISVVAVLLRLVARQMKGNFGIDDATIVLAVCFIITCNALNSVSISYGIGAHVNTLTEQQGIESTKWVVIANAVAVHGFSWPKLAVVFLLRKLFLPSRFTQYVLFGSIAFLICCAIALSYMLLGCCTPVAHQWDKSIPGTCWNPAVLTDFAIFVGAYSAVLDLSYAFYPVYKIWNLQMSLGRRFGYCCIMSLGLVAFAFTVVKCTKLPALDDPSDPTYLTAQLLLWTNIESNVVTLAACIPTLSPLVRYIKDHTVNTFSKYSSSRRPSFNLNKYGNTSRRSKHVRLTEDERNGSTTTDQTFEDYKSGHAHQRTISNAKFGGNSNRRRDLESGPPSTDSIELLDNPLKGRSSAWAGKPNSSRGSVLPRDDEDSDMWKENAIGRNVEVSISYDPRRTPESRL